MPIRLKFWPTVVTVPALALLLGLGFWQIERMQWRDALIAEIQTRGAAPAIALPSSQRIGLEDLIFRPVTVTGRYDWESELFLLNKVRKGRLGIHLVAPLVRADGAGIVLVDRGWIPLERREPESRAESQPDGDITVTGIVLTPEPRDWTTPDNNPAENQWFFIDLPAMAEAAGIWPAPEYYVFATAEEPAGDSPAPGGSQVSWPVANEWKIAVANDHLSYAVMLFILAAGLVAVYLVYHLSQRPDDDE